MLVTLSNWANLGDTSVGSVPLINTSLVIKSLGVYALGNIAGQVPFSTSTLTTVPGTLKVLEVLGIYFITALIIFSFWVL